MLYTLSDRYSFKQPLEKSCSFVFTVRVCLSFPFGSESDGGGEGQDKSMTPFGSLIAINVTELGKI